MKVSYEPHDESSLTLSDFRNITRGIVYFGLFLAESECY